MRLPIKRLYLPMKKKLICMDCGRTNIVDFERDALLCYNPVVNEPIEIEIVCMDCDAGLPKINLQINFDVVDLDTDQSFFEDQKARSERLVVWTTLDQCDPLDFKKGKLITQSDSVASAFSFWQSKRDNHDVTLIRQEYEDDPLDPEGFLSVTTFYTEDGGEVQITHTFQTDLNG